MPIARHLRVVDSGMSDEFVENAIRAAFATDDVKHVNQHFGSAQSFAIYAVDGRHARLLEVCQFGDLDEDGNEDKLTAKFRALEGCVAVYSAAAGASAVAQLKNLGVTPVKVEMGVEIANLIESLQADLVAGPTGWLAQALRPEKDDSRFDEMEAEGWVE